MYELGEKVTYMTTYTIENFWKSRLAATEPTKIASLIQGWSFQNQGLDTFTEAPLTLSEEVGLEDKPWESSILLVSAPGAVGKTTLAKQIAFSTGSLYVDLAEAAPVGANTLIGGVANSGLYEHWTNGSVAVLIDGLDEARLKVTQEAFDAFLLDVATQAADRQMPTVLFGRTGAIIHAWIVLTETLQNVPILEIGYYGIEDAVEFAEASLRASKSDDRFGAVERDAVSLLLSKLRDQTANEGGRFAGYAPVLQAVAKQVESESDPQGLIARINRGEESVTLQSIASALLVREQNKLRTLQLEDTTLVEKLYSTEEQLGRIAAYVYNGPPPQLPEMSAEDERTYTTALETWVPEHPFLDGGRGFSSAVFGAMVVTKALITSEITEAALQGQLASGAATNPFLFEFYTAARHPYIGPEHIGVVYASLRANLSLGEYASLFMSGAEEIENEDDLKAEVDFLIGQQDGNVREFQFETDSAGIVRLGKHVEDVDIVMPMSTVEIGPSTESVLVCPINIQCNELALASNRVIIESPARQSEQCSSVYLEAGQLNDSLAPSSVHLRRSSVRVDAFWPGVRNYPWTRYASEPVPTTDPRVDEALRRLRQFVIAFRSHGRGRLARSARKIDSTRMTKGTGQFVLDLLKDAGIVSLEHPRYFLDPARLAEVTGTTYADCAARRFEQKTVDFIQTALEGSEP